MIDWGTDYELIDYMGQSLWLYISFLVVYLKELLYNKNLALDSAKLKGTGFTDSIPELKIDSLREVRMFM